MPRHPLLTFLTFLALATAMRWGSFFISVIDLDESTYIVHAGEVLRGEIYLRDLIDTKPVGIVWIYAALIKLTGGSIVALRAAAAGVVAVGAFLLSRIAYRLTGTAASGYVAGAVYCLANSVFKYYGVSPNTEIFFNVCTIGAFSLLVATPRKRWYAAGLLLGIGCAIKPFVVAECLVVGAYLIWIYQTDWKRLLGQGILLMAGFVTPLAGIVGYYAYHGLLPELYFYTFEVGADYPVTDSWIHELKYMADYALRFSPLLLFAWWARRGVSEPPPDLREWNVFLMLQLVLVTWVILLSGKPFGHYQVQLHPVLALFVGTAVGLRFRTLGSAYRTWTMVAVCALALGFVHFFYYRAKVDTPRLVAEYLADRMEPQETLLCLEGFQIVHHLLDRPAPTPFIHRHLFFESLHRGIFEYDEEEELRQLLANDRLRYIVGSYGMAPSPIPAATGLMNHFEAIDTLAERAVIYRRK